MTKRELISLVAGKAQVPTKEVKKVLETYSAVVEECLVKGEKVAFEGIGTFQIKVVAERKARHILEDRIIIVPEHNTPKFRFFPALKNVIRNTEIKEV